MKAQFLAGRSQLLLKKNKPDILFALGLGTVLVGAVVVANAARKHDEVAEDNELYLRETAQDIQFRGETNQITEAQAKQEYAKAHAVASYQWVKLYGKGAAIMVAGTVSLVAGHMESKQRIGSLMAAYSVLDKTFKTYRERVVEELGGEKDVMFLHGKPDKKPYVEVDEITGKNKKRKYDSYHVDSEYARIFDEYNVNWRNEPHLNAFFLKSQQVNANLKLQAQGHLFLNEVWDLLGMERTKAGSIVGWVKDSENGDGVIDFGLYSECNSAFMNGLDPAAIIDPNVDGVIYDLL